jgi:hypothetical protein
MVPAMKILFYLLLWVSFMTLGFAAAIATKSQILQLI